MRLNEECNIYEYVAVYVDDLAIAMKDCDTFNLYTAILAATNSEP